MKLNLVNQLKRVQKIKGMAVKYLQNSIFSAFMMSNLIDDLLDLAKLENSAFELHVERANMVDIVEKAF